MNILVAPNAFKNSLPAAKAAAAIGSGLQQSKLTCSITLFPVGDGGDGTGALLVGHLKGEWIKAEVHDPLGRQLIASFGWIKNDRTAVIELADASGLRLLQPAEYDPLHTTTVGTGELIRQALNKGASRILLCIGGSATVDGGAGMLKALGVKLLDVSGKELGDTPASLSQLAAIDTTEISDDLRSAQIIVLCDVDNVLLGTAGAAAVFGPQKGASPTDVAVLEKRLTHFRDVVAQCTGKDMAIPKHGGAAGGIGAALHAFFNARLVQGIDYFLDTTGFARLLKQTDLVITGEGRIDLQTLQGKGPFGVARKAKEYGIPVIAMAGQVSDIEKLSAWFDQVIPVNEPGKVSECEMILSSAYAHLEKAACILGDRLSLST